MSRRLLNLLACLLVSGAATSCVGNKAYRTCLGTPSGQPCSKPSVLREKLTTKDFDREMAACTGPCPSCVRDCEWPYELAFVEFDDRGEMFDRRQLAAAVDTITRAKANAPAGTQPVVAVFIHGWKNNASESSGNVWGFRQILAGLSLEYKVPGGPFSPVVGVYIGWRGAVVSAPLLKEFTFFDRHGKSQNLPGPHMSEALVKIMQAAKGRNFEDPTMSVLIGHSFGGAVLETALSETIATLVTEAQSTGTPIRWPADLIMFLNEAQEATRSYQLIESLIANVSEREACLPAGTSQTMQAPAIISVSSTGDSATRVAFPAVQSLARPFNSLRKYPEGGNAVGIGSQTSMFFRTTAHMGEFQSHLVRRYEPAELDALGSACKPTLRFTLTGKPTIDSDAPGYALIEKPGTKNRTPYWVFQVPPDVVPDHSTIFTPVFRSFLVTLIKSRDQMKPHNTAVSPPAP
jgi:hypothetical protein